MSDTTQTSNTIARRCSCGEILPHECEVTLRAERDRLRSELAAQRKQVGLLTLAEPQATINKLMTDLAAERERSEKLIAAMDAERQWRDAAKQARALSEAQCAQLRAALNELRMLCGRLTPEIVRIALGSAESRFMPAWLAAGAALADDAGQEWLAVAEGLAQVSAWLSEANAQVRIRDSVEEDLIVLPRPEWERWGKAAGTALARWSAVRGG